MPKLADIRLSVENAAATLPQERFVPFRFAVEVTDEGVFRATLPDELIPLATHFAFPPTVSITTLRVRTCLTSPTLASLTAGLEALATSSLTPEITVERIIRYYAASRIDYWTGSSGRHYPNGAIGEEAGESGEWHTGTGARTTSSPGYALMVGAAVYDRKTIRHGEHTRIEYQRVGVSSSPAPDAETRLLNSWVNLALPEQQCLELPYTPEAASYFHKVQLALAGVAQRLQAHFGDPVRLQDSIARNQPLLPGAPHS